MALRFFTNESIPTENYKNYFKETDHAFVLQDEKELIASCTVSIENETVFEINDVLVEEKFRGNNYSVLLLFNVLLFMEETYTKGLIKIHCENDSPAYFCYSKIFGEYYRKDNRYSYFCLSIA